MEHKGGSSLLTRMSESRIYFIVLFAFEACKKNTNNILNRQKAKTNIAIYKSLGNSKEKYIDKHYASVQGPLLKAQPWGFKIEKDPNAQTLPILTRVAQNKRRDALILTNILLTNYT